MLTVDSEKKVRVNPGDTVPEDSWAVPERGPEGTRGAGRRSAAGAMVGRRSVARGLVSRSVEPRRAPPLDGDVVDRRGHGRRLGPRAARRCDGSRRPRTRRARPRLDGPAAGVDVAGA